MNNPIKKVMEEIEKEAEELLAFRIEKAPNSGSFDKIVTNGTPMFKAWAASNQEVRAFNATLSLLQKIKLYEEALKELPKKIESYCRCHEDYKRREREDPTCQFHDARDFAEQFIKSALDKAKELK